MGLRTPLATSCFRGNIRLHVAGPRELTTKTKIITMDSRLCLLTRWTCLYKTSSRDAFSAHLSGRRSRAWMNLSNSLPLSRKCTKCSGRGRRSCLLIIRAALIIMKKITLINSGPPLPIIIPKNTLLKSINKLIRWCKRVKPPADGPATISRAKKVKCPQILSKTLKICNLMSSPPLIKKAQIDWEALRIIN